MAEGMKAAGRPTGPIPGIAVAAVLFAAGQFTGVFAGGTEAGLSWGAQMILTASFAGSALLLALWIRFKERRSFSTLGFRRAGALRHIGLGAAVGAGMISLVALVNVLTGQAALGTPRWEMLLPSLLLLLGFTIQASTEEMFTRGYVFQAVSWRWGVLAALLAQTAWFTVMHAANGGVSLVPVLNLILVAVFLMYWCLAEGGLWGACAFHTIWNWGQGNFWGADVSNLEVQTSVFDYTPAAGASEALNGGGFGLEGSLISSLLLGGGAVAAALLLRRKRDRAS